MTGKVKAPPQILSNASLVCSPHLSSFLSESGKIVDILNNFLRAAGQMRANNLSLI